MTINRTTELQFPDALLEGYEPVRTLGEGASGVVLLARDRSLDRMVAVKLLRAFGSATAEERFRREAGILARFKHPNLLHLYTFGVEDGMPYLVTDYVEGASLRRACQDGSDPLGLLLQVAPGLDVLHREGLVHRDIKPDNILVDPKRGAVLADFGLAYDPSAQPITATGSVVGTIGYMAPELLRGKPATPASDWFAWGTTLYELREGRLPYARTSVAAVMLGKPIPEPTFQRIRADSAEAEGLRRLLAEDPALRPGSAREVADLLAGRAPDSPSAIRRRDRAERAPPGSDPAGVGRSTGSRKGREKGSPRAPRRVPALVLILGGAVAGFLAAVAWVRGPEVPAPPASPSASPPAPDGPEARLNARQTIDLWRHRARDLDVAGRLAALVAPIPHDGWSDYFKLSGLHRLRDGPESEWMKKRNRRLASAPSPVSTGTAAARAATPSTTETGSGWEAHRRRRLELAATLEAATGDLPHRSALEAELPRLGSLLADPGQPLGDRLELFHALQAFGHVDAFWAAWGLSPPYRVDRALSKLVAVHWDDSAGQPGDLTQLVPGRDPGRGASLLFAWATELDRRYPYLLPADADLPLADYPGVAFALSRGQGQGQGWSLKEHSGLDLRVWLGDQVPRHGYRGATLKFSVANFSPPSRMILAWNELRIDVWADPACAPTADPRSLAFPECDAGVTLPPAVLRPGWNNLRIELAALPGLQMLRSMELDWIFLELE